MIWAGLAGVCAGLVLGFLGAGGTVVAIPVLLAGTNTEAHTVLGTNALGVALAACALFLWRYREHRAGLRETLIFMLPGITGVYAGASLGLVFPSHGLIFLLGLLLFAVAGWVAYTSTRPFSGEPRTDTAHVEGDLCAKARLLIPATFLVGALSGFFGIGGGFMIVPALMFMGGMPIELATVMSLLPIGAFALMLGGRYLLAGAVVLPWSGTMAVCALAGGAAGIRLNQRLPRPLLQRAFAILLVFIGIYFIQR